MINPLPSLFPSFIGCLLTNDMPWVYRIIPLMGIGINLMYIGFVVYAVNKPFRGYSRQEDTWNLYLHLRYHIPNKDIIP